MNRVSPKQLEQTVDILTQVLDTIDVGVHIVNSHGETIMYNKKMTEIESMPPHEVLHKNLLDVFLFKEEQTSTLLQALHKGQHSYNIKQQYYNNKGFPITAVNDTHPLKDKDGEIIGAFELSKDITRLEVLMKDQLHKSDQTRYTFSKIIGQSEAISQIIHEAKRATRTSSSVLLTGETGTGKEIFAQSIHNGSERAGGPFISQNCAALPDNLIEGILFGTKKGAFTGAVEHPGLFEQAEGGTLLLDEINSLNLPLQAKLLRAIQEKTIRRVGDTKDTPVDVRIISTMNEDPFEAVSNGRLRKDLFYRLGVVSLYIPPLKDRYGDIPLLVEHFLAKFNKRFQMQVDWISADVLELFEQYEWPGNVRELEHVIESAMNIMSTERQMELYHLPMHIRRRFTAQTDPTEGKAEHVSEPKETFLHKPLKEHLAEVENYYIKQALTVHKGNISQAAKALGISRQNLQYRLKKMTLSEEDL
ncbi:sigma 54-interacting transcriptional regulator [Alkalihalophilus pseudofirmus]|uniref:sigma-54 interaction domain-containing protein n=1 Tax=Alkalihalophilus pseudofirmus TaxID=79885 RepID=UPI00259B0939|nr:sigma 54-interacting transcriptional regulator [Alkalihalophilus pseudofirmus]WEG16064.1 sigma 54-interacting transcriptional regulator [Alkalihalophilus pseudofirmus]